MVRKYAATEIRQKQIVDAACKVIIKYGTEHVTVKRIAREVGISETAIYRHFKSKKDVMSLLVEQIEERLFGDLTRAVASGFTPLETLDNVMKSHLSSIEQRKGISFQVIAEIMGLGDKKLNAKVSRVIDKYIENLKNLLVEGVKSGEVSKDIDLEAAATALFGIIQGLVNIWALNNYSFDLQQKYTTLWNIFRKAIVNHE